MRTLFFCFGMFVVLASQPLEAQAVLYSHNCDNLGGWTNTGLRYPTMQPGFDFQAVVPIVPINDHTPGAGGGVFYTEGNNFYQQAQALHYILYQIESPPINLTGFNDTRLEFFMQLRSETGNWDGAYVEWSTNGGNSWILLNNEICPATAYDGNMSLNPSSTPYFQLLHPAWFNFRTTWTRVLIDVSAYDNFPDCRIRFTFHSDEAANDRGWAIDDIAVVSVAGIEIHGNSLNIPHNNVPNPGNLTDFGLVAIGNSQTHTFYVVNPGESPLNLTGTPAVVSNNPAFVVSQQPNPLTVPPGDSVSFQVQFVPNAPGVVNGQLSIAHSDSYSVCLPINPLLINLRGEAQNTAPFITNPISDTSVCLNSPAITWNFTVQDNEQAPAALQVVATSSNQALVPNANLILGGLGANRTLQLTPIPGMQGSALITMVINDGQAQFFDSTFTFLITVQDTIPPVALCQNFTLNLNAQQNAQLLPAQINAGSTDNCGIQSIVLDQTQFDCSHVPQTQVTLTVTDLAGLSSQCQANISVVPIQLQVQYSTSHFPGGTQISCFGASDGAIGIAATGGCPPLSFQWQNPAGANGDSLSGLQAGTYNLTVSDGTGQSLSLSIDLNQPPPLLDQSTFVPPSCAGYSDGMAQLAASGGAAPYGFSIGPALHGLSEGLLNYTITDLNGCQWNNQVEILAPDSLYILAHQTYFDLVCGEHAQLSFEVSGGTQPYRFLWNPSSILSCENCNNPEVLPFDNTRLTLEVRDTNGCSAVEEFLIHLACNVYVPDAFTPNGDGINEVFLVRAGAVQSYYFHIHDRWGKDVFESNNIEKGWNGNDLDGQPYPPGVYSWRLLLKLPGGKEKELFGKVHLIR